MPLWALHCPLLAVPAVGRMLGAETGPREPSVVNGDNGRRFWAPDETPQDSVLPKEQRDWRSASTTAPYFWRAVPAAATRQK